MAKKKKKTLLANEGLLFREFLAVHCPAKREPCTKESIVRRKQDFHDEYSILLLKKTGTRNYARIKCE